MAKVRIQGDKLKDIIKKDTVFVCIGSNNHINDSFAPMVGSMLKEANISNKVYGTLEEPINGLNYIEETLRITREYDSKNILSIDACLGDAKDIGTINVIKGTGIVPRNCCGDIIRIEVGSNCIKGITTHDVRTRINNKKDKELVKKMAEKTVEETLKYLK